MSGDHPLITLLIFVVTYVMISVQNIGRVKLYRPAASTIGVALLFIFGAISFEEAIEAIDFHTIVLLLGMMILTAYLGIAGFFDYFAYKIMSISKNGVKLILFIIITSAFLSALFVNDTICVFMTPVILKIALASNLNPIPLLIALATSANIGSAATIIGNPQNMLIGMASKISFIEFAMKISPISAICLIPNFLIIYIIYRKDIKNFKISTKEVEIDRKLVLKTISVFIFVLILFILEVYPISVSAIIGAAIMFAIGGVSPRKALEKVDGGLLLFFCNLFIIMHAFERDYGQFIISVMNWEKDLFSYLFVSFVTVAGSNLVSNVPFVMMTLPIAKMDGEFWLILAMASTFAGNLTLLGSVANLIVAGIAERHGVNLSFFEYLKVGFPLTIVTVIVGAAMLYYI
ncbi:MAG: anion transporter [Archaeoglobaceae archaeon]|nr:anion transporter [Archaeoglobaceae archaeon]MDW7990286.1 anion transporter [Archaeoglobaceae archaeon]